MIYRGCFELLGDDAPVGGGGATPVTVSARRCGGGLVEQHLRLRRGGHGERARHVILDRESGSVCLWIRVRIRATPVGM